MSAARLKEKVFNLAFPVIQKLLAWAMRKLVRADRDQREKLLALGIHVITAEFHSSTRLIEGEFNWAIPVIQKLVWADRDQREKLQALGLNVIPANFYSSIPSIAEVKNSYEYAESSIPYLDETLFDKDALREELSWLAAYSVDFAPPEDGDKENGNYFFWNNGVFSSSDAMAYYAFLRKLKPGNVIEIGSGFSTLVAREALIKNGRGKLTCIEPFPRPFLKKLDGINLEMITAQEISADYLNNILSDGDVLFIDSTHTVKTGSDCLHLYLRLLPKITKKIYIHVHDIFLPFGMPQIWLLDLQIHWAEQYLLLAWMIENQRVKVLFGSAYHEHFNPDLLKELMRGRYPAACGSSFWFEYDGRRR